MSVAEAGHRHHHGKVCPWWVAYLLDSPVRRWLLSPETIVGPYVGKGMVVLDVGCGTGIYSVPMAKMVGESGKVVCVDIQERMLNFLRRKSARAGVTDRIVPHLCGRDGFGVSVAADFALAFWMVHEVPDCQAFMREIAANLKPGGKFLIAEPKNHVTPEKMEQSIAHAQAAGLVEVNRPEIRMSRTVLLTKPKV